MAKKNKNRERRLSIFSRYIRNEMSERERHAYEKELQKDPFEEEAMEGLSTLSVEELEEDLKSLDQRLDTRLKIRRFPVALRYAAAVIVLVIISSIILVREFGREEMLVSENIVQESAETEARDEARKAEVTGRGEIEQAVKTVPAREDEKNAGDAREEINTVRVAEEEVAEPAENQAMMLAEAADLTGKAVKAEDEQAPRADTGMAVAGMTRGGRGVEQARVDSVITEVLDDAIVQQDLSRAAKSAAATPVSMAAGERKKEAIDYKAPEPEEGFDRFYEYVRSRTVFPEDYSGTGREEVQLKFSVDTAGMISAIEVVKSPGEFFTDLAIKLLKEGPTWEPASRSGELIEEKVSLKLEFNVSR